MVSSPRDECRALFSSLASTNTSLYVSDYAARNIRLNVGADYLLGPDISLRGIYPLPPPTTAARNGLVVEDDSALLAPFLTVTQDVFLTDKMSETLSFLKLDPQSAFVVMSSSSSFAIPFDTVTGVPAHQGGTPCSLVVIDRDLDLVAPLLLTAADSFIAHLPSAQDWQGLDASWFEMSYKQGVAALRKAILSRDGASAAATSRKLPATRDPTLAVLARSVNAHDQSWHSKVSGVEKILLHDPQHALTHLERALHEKSLTLDDYLALTVMITSFTPHHVDLSSFHIPTGHVATSLLQGTMTDVLQPQQQHQDDDDVDEEEDQKLAQRQFTLSFQDVLHRVHAARTDLQQYNSIQVTDQLPPYRSLVSQLLDSNFASSDDVVHVKEMTPDAPSATSSVTSFFGSLLQSERRPCDHDTLVLYFTGAGVSALELMQVKLWARQQGKRVVVLGKTLADRETVLRDLLQ